MKGGRVSDPGIKIEPVTFHSEGARLAGDLYLPGARRGPHPAVLLCHGYTGLRRLYMPNAARHLAAAGFAALAFDYKGWGDSEGPALRLDPYGRVADAAAALAYLTGRPEIATERIGAFGWSYGTGTAVWLAAHIEQVKAVVGVVGVAHGRRWLRAVRTDVEWREFMQRTASDRALRVETGRQQMVDRAYVLHMDPASDTRSAAQRRQAGIVADSVPMEFIDETLMFNPEWVAGRIAPRALMLISCDKDRVVPAEESMRLYEAAGDPKRLVVLEGYDHYDVYAGPAFDAAMTAAVDWFGSALCFLQQSP